MQYADIYRDGAYLAKNPTWHAEESPFKAKYILRLLEKNHLAPQTICEAGCGAGEVLKQLQAKMNGDCEFSGYDISPQASALSQARANGRLHFKLADITKEEGYFDLMLVLDVIEHLEDYFSFLRALRPKARHTIFHLPLDLSAQAVARKNGMMKRRVDHAHLHYFTKELGLQMILDAGYEVVDWSYLPRSNEIGPNPIQKLFRIPRAAFYAFHRDMAVRILGGYSLMVLAK